MSTATLVEFWITTDGSRWKAKFEYADLTPNRTQRPILSTLLSFSNGATAGVDGVKLNPDGIGGKLVVYATGLLSERIRRSDGHALTVTASAAVFDDTAGNTSSVLVGHPVLNRSAINDARDDYDFPIPDHTIPGIATPADLSHANLFANYDPAQQDFTNDSLHDFATDESGNSHNGYCRSPGVQARQIQFKRDYFGAGLHAYASVDSARIRVDDSTNGTDFNHDFTATSFAFIFVGETTASAVRLIDGGGLSLNLEEAFGGTPLGFVSANNTRRVIASNEKTVQGFTWNHSTSELTKWVMGRPTETTIVGSPSAAAEMILLLAPASSAQDFWMQRGVVYRSTTGPAVTDDEMRGLMSRAMQQYACVPRTLYVSATGNDANDGLSELTPLLTMGEALGRYRPAIGEQIRVKYGDTFASFGSINSGDVPAMLEGQSWNDRAVICGYGNRADGRYDFGINAFKSGVFSTIVGAGFSNPSGNHLSGSFDQAATEASPVNSPLSWAGSGGLEDVVMIDIWIEGRMNGILCDCALEGQSWFEVDRTQMEGIWAQGTENRPQGFYADIGMGGMIHCANISMSQPGHIGDGNRTIFDHGFYTYNYATTTDNCVVWDASAHGIMSRSVGVTQGCLTMQCPVGITGGHGGQTVYNNVCVGGSTQTPTGAARQIWTGSGTYNRIVDNLIIAEDSVLPNAVAMNIASFSYADNQGAFTPDSDWEVIVENNTIAGELHVRFDPERADDIGTLSFSQNILDCGSSILIESDDDLSLIALQTFNHNLYVSLDATPFENGGVAMNRASWDADIADGSPAVRVASPTYVERTRTPLTWHSSQKMGDGTYAGLMADAHAAHADGWDESWSAESIIAWIREGYGLIGENPANFGGEIPGIAVISSASPANILIDEAPDDGTINLGNIAVGTGTSVLLNIRNNAPQPGEDLTLGALSVTAGGTLSVDPSGSVIAAGSSQNAEVSVDTATPGARAITIQIPSDDPDNPVYTITVNASVLSVQDIAVDEAAHNGSIDLGSIALGVATSVDLTIRNAAQAPGTGLTLGVLSVGADGTITTNPSNQTIAAGASTAATISVDTTTAGARSIAVQIPSDDPDTPAYAITIDATVVGAELQVTLDETPVLDGGEIELNGLVESTQATITLDITNAGMADLTLGTIMTSGNLSITANGNPSGDVLASLDTVSLEILIDTSAVGPVSGSVSIPSNDADSPLEISASGVVAASANPSDDYTGPDTTQQFLNVAEADAIIALYLIGANTFRQAWQSLGADDKLVCIAHATIDFNAIPWDGRKVDLDQPNAFPRQDRYGNLMLPGGEVQYPPSLGGGAWSFPSLPREIRIGVALQAAARAADQLEIDQSMKITGMAAQGITGIGGAGTSWATDGMIARQPSSRLHESVRRLVQKYLRVTAEVV